MGRRRDGPAAEDASGDPRPLLPGHPGRGGQSLKTDLLDYSLPERLIAQTPAPRRRDARLLVLDRKAGTTGHRAFTGLPPLLAPGDLLVVNDTKVIRGRLRVRKSTGGAAELLLLSPVGETGGREERWEALARPSKRLREGMVFDVAAGLRVVLARRLDAARWEVRIAAESSVAQALEGAGEVPLPPYIRRRTGDPAALSDAERYQTVYARHPGSVAAPTAGLHFDREMLDDLGRRGVGVAAVTLSVGYGTFSPIRADELAAHRLHPERYSLPRVTAEAVAAARALGGRVIAVGTTAVRTLETCAAGEGRVVPGEGTTDLFIRPGYRFRVVDALLTNFHLPRTSLLALVMAFGGVDLVTRAYAEAVAREYRFYSYGDAMFLK